MVAFNKDDRGDSARMIPAPALSTGCNLSSGNWLASPGNTTNMTDAVHVREFTAGAGQPAPDFPEEMSTSEVLFLGKMMLDEIMELFVTVLSGKDAKDALKGFIANSKDIQLIRADEEAGQKALIISEQADALVDVYYYSLNSAAQVGVNLSSIFDIVHAANMAKRDPATGVFLKRDDGKIIKPKGWQAPDVKSEIERQLRDGAWKNASSSDALHVREFTAGAGQPTPDRPCLMSVERVKFLGKMMLDEIMELFATVLPPAEAKQALTNFIDESTEGPARQEIPLIDSHGEDEALIIAEQADALVDVYYYSLNAAAKKGVNVSSIFDIVHAANMAKRDPVSGEFLKREDGKIIKPKGWQPPDVLAEIERQMKHGAWTPRLDDDALSRNNTPCKA